MSDISEWIPISEAARLLDVSESTIRRLIRDGELPVIQPGTRAYRVRRRDVLARLQPLVWEAS